MDEADGRQLPRRHALVKLGGIEPLKEAYRDRRGVPTVETVVQDLRFALRMFARSPGFAAVAISALAIGVAANILIFGFANALFLRPLPIAAPDRAVRAYTNRHSNTAYADYEEYRDRNRTLSGLAIFQGASLSLRTDAAPEHVFGMAVSGNYFEILGVRAAIGRAIVSTDDRPGAPAVVVLSDGAWRRRFGADPAVVGRTVTINGHVFTIVGVTAREFTGTLAPLVPDLWVTWNAPSQQRSPDPERPARRQQGTGHMIGRLRPAASIEQAQADLTAVAAALAREYPETNRGMTITVYPGNTLGDEIHGGAAAFVALLFAVVGLVLIIACVNLATLLLARSTARTREISIRLALGAGRRRLIRQLLTESLLLSALGGAAALAVAAIALRAIESASLPLPFPVGLDLGVDARVIAFALALTTATAVVFGLVPALQSSKTAGPAGLKAGASTAGRERSRLRAALVTAQVALSAVLLVVAAVLLRSLVSARAIDRGFSSERVMAATVDLETRGYTRERGALFLDQLLDRLERAPGVTAACLVDIVPLTLSNRTGPMLKEGQAPPATEEQADAIGLTYMNAVTRGHFRTLGIPLIAGRDFDAGDRRGRPDVAIVNETLARRFWPGESPIGKRLHALLGPDSVGPWIEVVGLARDSKYVTVGEDPKPFMYRPLAQEYTPVATLLVKASGAPLGALPAVRASVQALDLDLPIFNVSTLAAATSISLLPVQVAAGLAAALGAVALALAAIGIYGVMSYLVRQRRREIGIRMALGAQRFEVVRLLARQGMRWTVWGLALGLGAAALLTRLLAGLLYGVGATDAIAFAGIAALLASTAYAASYIPARRASAIDPVVTLRYEG